MTQYSIKELEHLSGIKAHTIRIWEQRYELFCPKRTSTNIRYYEDDDLKKLLNVAALNNVGYKISKIAQMSPENINKEILKISREKVDPPVQISQMTTSMLELDKANFNETIDLCIKEIGFERTVLDILFPFLNQIGILWRTNNLSPAHEHFISNLVKQKLYANIDRLPQINFENMPKFILFLPEGELHEMGLLFIKYLLKVRSFNVVYLGQSLPFEDLEKAVTIYKPDYLVTACITSPANSELNSFVERLDKTFPGIKILIVDNRIDLVKHPVPDHIKFISKTKDFVEGLNTFID